MSYRCHKIVEIKVLLDLFARWWKDPDPDPDPDLYKIMTDPGGQKTLGTILRIWMDPQHYHTGKKLVKQPTSVNQGRKSLKSDVKIKN